MIGFLNIYKPSGVTSNFVVQKIKKRFHIDKIGHMGTLDPLASGILPIAIGKATRMFDYSLNKTKRYTAIFDFGYTTDSLDITGERTSDVGYVPSREEIIQVTNKLIGEYDQVPPMFSAKNVNGVRAYDLARKGISVELKPNKITIFKLDLLEQISDYQYKFDIVCSSGTYIRAIARDLAKMLDTYACMSFLERTETGNFKIDNSIYFDDIIQSDSLEKYLISPIEAFDYFDKISIDSKALNDLLNGKKIDYNILTKDTFVTFDNMLVGIAKKNCDYLQLETFLFETKD